LTSQFCLHEIIEVAIEHGVDVAGLEVRAVILH
jgi:hypothetical protein